MATPFIDFAAVKERVTIEQVAQLAGLTLKKDGKSLRCECPAHGGGPRGLVITPSEKDKKGDDGVFYCFGSKEGGDRLGLLAHVNKTGQYAAVKHLAEHFGLDKAPAVPEEKNEGGGAERGFKPLPYLAHDDPAVLALGIPPDVAEATGVGHAPRGVHRGRVAIPLRQADGAIVGYISLSADTVVQTPPRWVL